MRTTTLFYIIGFISFICIQCSPNETYISRPQSISNYFSETQQAFKTLDSLATEFQKGKVSSDILQNALTESRLAYKKIEFYVAYFHPEYTNKYLNGAPLLKIEKSGNQPTVSPPEGLQVLDELIFSENPSEEKVHIARLAKNVHTHFTQVASALASKTLIPEDIITASRLQLVRIFTLGVTGFDTPGSANGIEEAKVSLEAIGEVLNFSETKLSEKQKKEATQLIQAAIAQLSEATSFESFDRLTFLTNHIDPLYKLLGHTRNLKKPEHITQQTGWNLNSESIFSADFLDPYFFAQLTQEEDSKALRELGEELFYDPILSNSKSISCASCHNPQKAFTDGLPTSSSNKTGEFVLRNAPTLLNAAYAERFFYDARAFNLEQQVEHVVFNSKEFDTDYIAILAKLSVHSEYPSKFKNVFVDEDISRRKIASALASYVISLRSFNSPFDRFVRGEIPEISSEVKKGFNLFMGKGACATCHFAPNFSGLVPPLYSDTETEILGVLKNPNSDIPVLDTDEGRWNNGIASEAAWIYEKSFKTTTVRNSFETAPYFHNGAYNTLEEVLDFYNKGGGAGMGLEVTNQTLPETPLDLSEQEIQAIIAFLKALSDNPYTTQIKVL